MRLLMLMIKYNAPLNFRKAVMDSAISTERMFAGALAQRRRRR
jgi:hypothetical protein